MIVYVVSVCCDIIVGVYTTPDLAKEKGLLAAKERFNLEGIIEEFELDKTFSEER